MVLPPTQMNLENSLYQDQKNPFHQTTMAARANVSPLCVLKYWALEPPYIEQVMNPSFTSA